jgi:hypothetical protein
LTYCRKLGVVESRAERSNTRLVVEALCKRVERGRQVVAAAVDPLAVAWRDQWAQCERAHQLQYWITEKLKARGVGATSNSQVNAILLTECATTAVCAGGHPLQREFNFTRSVVVSGSCAL